MRRTRTTADSDVHAHSHDRPTRPPQLATADATANTPHDSTGPTDQRTRDTLDPPAPLLFHADAKLDAPLFDASRLYYRDPPPKRTGGIHAAGRQDMALLSFCGWRRKSWSLPHPCYCGGAFRPATPAVAGHLAACADAVRRRTPARGIHAAPGAVWRASMPAPLSEGLSRS